MSSTTSGPPSSPTSSGCRRRLLRPEPGRAVMTRILGDVEAIGEVFTAGVVVDPGRCHHARRGGRRDARPPFPPHAGHLRRGAACSSWSPWSSGGRARARLPGRAGPPGAPERGAPGNDLGHGGHPALRARGGAGRGAPSAERALPAGAVPPRRAGVGCSMLSSRRSAPSRWRPSSGGAASRSSTAR